MIRRTNLALMEAVVAEVRRKHADQQRLQDYLSDWTRAQTVPLPVYAEERSVTVSLNGQDH